MNQNHLQNGRIRKPIPPKGKNYGEPKKSKAVYWIFVEQNHSVYKQHNPESTAKQISRSLRNDWDGMLNTHDIHVVTSLLGK